MKKYLSFLLCFFLLFSPKLSRGQNYTIDDLWMELTYLDEDLMYIMQYTQHLPNWVGLQSALDELKVIAALAPDDDILLQYLQTDVEWIRLYLDDINVFNFEDTLWSVLSELSRFVDDVYGSSSDDFFDYMSDLPVQINNPSLNVDVLNWDDIFDLIADYPFHVVVDAGIQFPDFPSSSFTFDYSYLDDVDSLSHMLLNGDYYFSGRRFYWNRSLDKDNTPADVRQTYYNSSSDWFSAVHQQLSLLLAGQTESHQTALTILWKLCANDDDAVELKDELNERSSELASALSDFSQNDVSRYLDFSPPSVLTENKFSGASSHFLAQCPEELTLDLAYFTPSGQFSGSDFRYQFNIDLSPYQSFFSTCRTVALVMWWLVSFVFSFFVFRLIYKACASCSFYFLKITGNL